MVCEFSQHFSKTARFAQAENISSEWQVCTIILKKYITKQNFKLRNLEAVMFLHQSIKKVQLPLHYFK